VPWLGYHFGLAEGALDENEGAATVVQKAERAWALFFGHFESNSLAGAVDKDVNKAKLLGEELGGGGCDEAEKPAGIDGNDLFFDFRHKIPWLEAHANLAKQKGKPILELNFYHFIQKK
jgi:hypothetical protein